jgi:hypothetical protein
MFTHRNKQLAFVVVLLLQGCANTSPLPKASIPTAYTAPPAPITSQVAPENTEPWMSCAAGGIKTAIRQGVITNTKVIVMPATNHTRDANLPDVLSLEMAHVVKGLGLTPFMAASNALWSDMNPVAMLRTEISVYDRTIQAAEAEREYGLDFGKGGGSSSIRTPSSDSINHGAIRAVATTEQMLKGVSGKEVYMVAQTHATRANVFKRTTSNGTQFFLVMQYGNSLVTKQIAGAQRAFLTAARSAAAGALLKQFNIDPAICNI